MTEPLPFLVRSCYASVMARYEDERLGRWAYDITWGTVGGVSRPVGIWLQSLDDPPRAVSRYVLRAVELHEAAQRSRSLLEQAARFEGTDLGDKLGRVAQMQPAPKESKGGRRPISDETLRLVATLYRTAPDPAAALDDAFPRRSAEQLRKYVLLARRRKDPLTGEPFLDPTLRKRRPRRKEG